MEINNLAIFIRAAELANVTRAATELGYTQSACSHILGRLEREFGLALFYRKHNGVELTAAGETLLPLARDLVQGQARMQDAAAKLAQRAEGLIRIGSITSVAIQWLPALIDDFVGAFPGTSVQIFDGDYEEVEQWLTGQQVDCGFLSSSTEKNFALHPLKKDPMMVVLPKTHPLCRYDVIPLAALKEEKMLIPAEGLHYDVGDILRAANSAPPKCYDLISDYSAISLVRKGYGLTILPELLLDGYSLDGVELRPLEANNLRTICVATLAGKVPSPITRAFVEYVVNWAKK